MIFLFISFYAFRWWVSPPSFNLTAALKQGLTGVLFQATIFEIFSIFYKIALNKQPLLKRLTFKEILFHRISFTIDKSFALSPCFYLLFERTPFFCNGNVQGEVQVRYNMQTPHLVSQFLDMVWTSNLGYPMWNDDD